MKKIDKLLLVLFSLFLFCVSCSDDEYTPPPVVSEKYVLSTEQVGSTETLSLYVIASNRAGGANLGGNFVKNEELEGTLKLLLSLNPELIGAVKQLNYIDMISDQNLVISYNDANGKEFIFPDMLKEDGSLAKGLKYRKTFDKIHLRFSEKLARSLSLPALGELAPTGALTHRMDTKGYLVYLNRDAIKFYLDMAKTMKLEMAELELINVLASQYSATSDVLEIGIYLKKIE